MDPQKYTAGQDINFEYTPVAPSTQKKRRKKKKKPATTAEFTLHADGQGVTINNITSASVLRGAASAAADNIWNVTASEERMRVRAFWLSLSDAERLDLVQLDKEVLLAKLRKQRHPCSCSVCGRKKLAIEQELEALYKAYYAEIEAFGGRQHEIVLNYNNTPEPLDEDSEYGEYYEQYDEIGGGILSVADDLLKNDGRRFVDVMEHLAAQRIQRELPVDHCDEFDEFTEYDDSSSILNEDQQLESEQRLTDGRRMLQIFAARMFEQRVLNAYREHIARERQQQLLLEIEEEDQAQTLKEQKKQKDKEKKKDKKKSQKQLKEDAEKKRLQELELQKQENQRLQQEKVRQQRLEDEKRKAELHRKDIEERMRRLELEEKRAKEEEAKIQKEKESQGTQNESKDQPPPKEPKEPKLPKEKETHAPKDAKMPKESTKMENPQEMSQPKPRSKTPEQVPMPVAPAKTPETAQPVSQTITLPSAPRGPASNAQLSGSGKLGPAASLQSLYREPAMRSVSQPIQGSASSVAPGVGSPLSLPRIHTPVMQFPAAPVAPGIPADQTMPWSRQSAQPPATPYRPEFSGPRVAAPLYGGVGGNGWNQWGAPPPPPPAPAPAAPTQAAAPPAAKPPIQQPLATLWSKQSLWSDSTSVPGIRQAAIASCIKLAAEGIAVDGYVPSQVLFHSTVNALGGVRISLNDLFQACDINSVYSNEFECLRDHVGLVTHIRYVRK